MPLQFSLHQATTPLLPTLSQISSLAFEHDTHTRLKTLSTGNTHATSMLPALTSWLSVPERCRLLVAITSTGEIAGSACWSFRCFSPDSIPSVPIYSGKVNLLDMEIDEDEGKGKEKPEGIQKLEQITNGSMQSWIAKLSPEGEKHMILVAITVHPAFQGQGVGSALIEWGTGIVDREGVYCWVHASEAGAPVLRGKGFQEVGRLEVDLDQFKGEVRNEEREDGMWGMYVFRYLRREARGGH